MRWFAPEAEDTVRVVNAPKLVLADPWRAVVSATAVVVAGVAVMVQVRYGVMFCEVRLRLAAEAARTPAPSRMPVTTAIARGDCLLMGLPARGPSALWRSPSERCRG